MAGVHTGMKVGNSKAMRDLMAMMTACARSDATVLIQGETGSGKEVVCRELHRLSTRSGNPLVAINCAAIPAPLLESELFGHRKGAFTGALSDRAGRFEKANGGTLFLDEIGDMPLELQVKLLRVLEEREVVPLGGEPLAVNVRVVAATHKDLKRLVMEGRFREDLYYRLNVVTLHVPALRERREDIEGFCQHFAALYATEAEPIRFTPRSLTVLRRHAWPGNLRELSNLIMRFSVLFPGQEIDILSLPRCTLPDDLFALVEQLNAEQEEAGSAVDVLSVLPVVTEQSHLAPAVTQVPAGDIVLHRQDDAVRWANSVTRLPREGIASREILQAIERKFIKLALSQANGNVSRAAELLRLQRTTLIQKIGKYRIRPVAEYSLERDLDAALMTLEH